MQTVSETSRFWIEILQKLETQSMKEYKNWYVGKLFNFIYW